MTRNVVEILNSSRLQSALAKSSVFGILRDGRLSKDFVPFDNQTGTRVWSADGAGEKGRGREGGRLISAQKQLFMQSGRRRAEIRPRISSSGECMPPPPIVMQSKAEPGPFVRAHPLPPPASPERRSVVAGGGVKDASFSGSLPVHPAHGKSGSGGELDGVSAIIG